MWKCGQLSRPQRLGPSVDRRAVRTQDYAHRSGVRDWLTARFGGNRAVFHVSTAIHSERREFCTGLCTPVHSVENARTAVDSPRSYAPDLGRRARRSSYPEVMDHFSTGYPQSCGEVHSRRFGPSSGAASDIARRRSGTLPGPAGGRAHAEERSRPPGRPGRGLSPRRRERSLSAPPARPAPNSGQRPRRSYISRL